MGISTNTILCGRIIFGGRKLSELMRNRPSLSEHLASLGPPHLLRSYTDFRAVTMPLLSLLCHYDKARLCINIITTLHQFGAASRIELQPHWLQNASAMLVKVKCQVLNRYHETNFANYSLIKYVLIISRYRQYMLTYVYVASPHFVIFLCDSSVATNYTVVMTYYQ